MSLPPGWERLWDANSNAPYYHDKNTNTTHWELPAHIAAQQAQPQAVAMHYQQAHYAPPQQAHYPPPHGYDPRQAAARAPQHHIPPRQEYPPQPQYRAPYPDHRDFGRYPYPRPEERWGPGQQRDSSRRDARGGTGAPVVLQTKKGGDSQQPRVIDRKEKLQKKVPLPPFLGKPWLYLIDLPKDITDEKLQEKYSEFGEVLIATMLRAKSEISDTRTGLVQFASMDSARKAILELHDKPWNSESTAKVQVRFRQGVFSTDSKTSRSTGLWVGNLPVNATEEGLKKIASKYGSIKEITIKRGRNGRRQALVDYHSLEAAAKALCGLGLSKYSDDTWERLLVTVNDSELQELLANEEETESDELWVTINMPRKTDGTLFGLEDAKGWIATADPKKLHVHAHSAASGKETTVIFTDHSAGAEVVSELRKIVPEGASEPLKISFYRKGSKEASEYEALQPHERKLILDKYNPKYTWEDIRALISEFPLLDYNQGHTRSSSAMGSYFLRFACAAAAKDAMEALKKLEGQPGHAYKQPFIQFSFAETKAWSRVFGVSIVGLPETSIDSVKELVKKAGLENFLSAENAISIRTDESGTYALIVFKGEWLAQRGKSLLEAVVPEGAKVEMAKSTNPICSIYDIPEDTTPEDIAEVFKGEDCTRPSFFHFWTETQFTGRGGDKPRGKGVTVYMTNMARTVLKLETEGKLPVIRGKECYADASPQERDVWVAKPKDLHEGRRRTEEHAVSTSTAVKSTTPKGETKVEKAQEVTPKTEVTAAETAPVTAEAPAAESETAQAPVAEEETAQAPAEDTTDAPMEVDSQEKSEAA